MDLEHGKAPPERRLGMHALHTRYVTGTLYRLSHEYCEAYVALGLFDSEHCSAVGFASATFCGTGDRLGGECY
jgi:hypothetical protein